jgi:hypothetical protein
MNDLTAELNASKITDQAQFDAYPPNVRIMEFSNKDHPNDVDRNVSFVVRGNLASHWDGISWVDGEHPLKNAYRGEIEIDDSFYAS